MAEASKKKKIFDSRYEIYDIIGRGASSVVYLAKHILVENKQVALKVLNPKNQNQNNSDLLRKESLALITARHKHTIRLEDFRSVDNICYLAMEYAPLSDLRIYTNSQGGKLPVLQAERFLKQIASALSFIHDIGMVHRDIKLDNILIINERQAKLSDFGVAILPGQSPSIEELKKGVGTMDYMAPEVIEGKECSATSDVYSLGLTFYEVFSGSNPLMNIPLNESFDIRQKSKFTNLSILNPEIPKSISDTIAKALSYNTADRFKNATEFLDFLNNFNETELDKSDNKYVSIHTGKTDTAFTPKTEKSINKKEITQIDNKEQEYESKLDPEIEKLINEVVDLDIKHNEEQEKQKNNPPTNEDIVDEEAKPTGFYSPQDLLTVNETDIEKFNYEQSQFHSAKSNKFLKLVFILLVFLVLGFGLKIIAGMFAKDSVPTTSTSVAENQNLFNLPKGIYSGQVFMGEGALVPISIMSFSEQQQLTILLGIPNWAPVTLNQENINQNLLNKGVFELKSNGHILHLQGLLTNDLLEGEIINLNSKVKNKWSAKLTKQG